MRLPKNFRQDRRNGRSNGRSSFPDWRGRGPARKSLSIIESTLSGRSFGHIVEMARQRGFVITIVFLFLDSADTCVARVKQRKRRAVTTYPNLTFVVGFIAVCGTSGASIASWPTTGPWSTMLGAIFRTWHLVPERLFRSATRHFSDGSLNC